MSARAMFGGGMAVVTIVGAIMFTRATRETPSAPSAAPVVAPVVAIVPVEPTKVRAETPATITADYGFSLESDGPIMVEYPGEKPFLFTPQGKECQQLPQPRNLGPKKFWDPSNPASGRISFRLYRGKGEC